MGIDSRRKHGRMQVVEDGMRLTQETLNAKDVAQLLGISEDAVYRAAKRGEIPCLRIGGRVLFIRRRVMEMLGHTDVNGVDEKC